MLKWLRKYNTYILVVGGCLLMVAFLLQGTLSELGKRGMIGGSAFKIGSHKVGLEEFSDSSREYNAVSLVVGGPREMEAFFRVENAEHWYLLVREAENAGMVGGKQDGQDFLDEIPGIIASIRSRFDFRNSYDQIAASEKMRIAFSMNRILSDTRMTDDQLYKAVAKFHGIRRLQTTYYSASQLGEKRMITEGRALQDQIKADYVMVPAEREMAGIPEPDESSIKSHYEKFKSVPKGGGEFGIGYTLPARVKLAWLEINSQLITDAVPIDEIEAEKRFQRKYPNGNTEGKNADDERKKFEAEVRKEAADKAMKTAIDAVRAEIDKATHKLDRDGEFLRLTPEWETIKPDFQKIREVVAKALLENHKVVVPAPKVVVQGATWVDAFEAPKLEGIGSSYLQRGQTSIEFARALFEVKEIAGRNDLALQVGVPESEPFKNNMGNVYFFVVLDARPESPPDSMEEVRPEIVKNIKRLAAYEKLKAKEPELLAAAVTGGLDALTKMPDGGPSVKVSEVYVSKKRTVAADAALDTQEFRNKVIAAASSLDPAVDPATVPNDKKTFSMPIPKGLFVFVGRIKGLTPLTVEQFRTRHNNILTNIQTDEFTQDADAFPFSLDNMEKRLNVTYPEEQERSRAERKAEKAAAAAKAKAAAAR